MNRVLENRTFSPIYMDVLAYISIVAAIIAVVGLWCTDLILYSVREKMLGIPVASTNESSRRKSVITKRKNKKDMVLDTESGRGEKTQWEKSALAICSY